MRRLPVRVRMAAAFAVAMALVLAATGLYVYTRVGDDLSRALDQDLRVRGQDLSVVVAHRAAPLTAESGGRLIERGESFAQLLDTRGTVVDATRPVGRRPLIDAAEVRRALRSATFIDRPSVAGLDEPARLLAISVSRDGQPFVLVVGGTRENRAETLRSLRTKLLIAGPVALVLATGLGYLLAGTGLRAVDAMRRRAADISADRPGDRLPVPPANDELRRLGTTLNEMLARLEEALEREREFVADAGHELRTPLALLRAELDYALHHAEDEQELREAVAEASAETDRLVQLAGDLLLMAGAERQRIPLQVEAIDARELLESVRNRFEWRASQAGRALEVEAAEALTFSGDRLRLEQALGNLVENALRHGDGRVRVEAQEREGRVELRVSDEGNGFPDSFVERAFDRFTRADPAHGGGGAGLGLAIVEAIARAHGGAATVRDGVSPRTEVALDLPVKIAACPRPSEQP
jgi:two-component system, OmpR family, sensor kinase